MKMEVTPVNPAVLSTELLILSDGRVLAHNLTPILAQVLRELNPTDQEMNQRITGQKTHAQPTKN